MLLGCLDASLVGPLRTPAMTRTPRIAHLIIAIGEEGEMDHCKTIQELVTMQLRRRELESVKAKVKRYILFKKNFLQFFSNKKK